MILKHIFRFIRKTLPKGILYKIFIAYLKESLFKMYTLSEKSSFFIYQEMNLMNFEFTFEFKKLN